MGGPVIPAKTSLSRLKALDELSSIDDQLQEAKQLCNHAARADMISKWLLGKLNSSNELRKRYDSWHLLSAAVRLLSKQKTAILLGTYGFMELLHTACADQDLPTKTMDAIGHFLDLILQLSAHSDGNAIKSVITVSNEAAASICGDWLQRVYDGCVQDDAESHLSAVKWLIDPALQIWALRKREQSDDEFFNSKCLVPSLLLLAISQTTIPRNSGKRKRSHRSSDHASFRSLQSLVAVHNILPARTLFFEGQSIASSLPHKQLPSNMEPTIKERLGPLKMALLRSDFPHIFAAVPLVFEIALSTVSTPTFKHRISERPWLETLVDVLLSCLSSQEQAKVTRILSKILRLVHDHTLSLSSQFLTKLVKQQAFSANREAITDWDLVVEVVKMDGTIFTEPTLAEAVFDAAAANGPSQDQLNNSVYKYQLEVTLLKDEVIVPIMKAFAKSRKLDIFAEAWHGQLLRANSHSSHSIWTDVDVVFGQHIEDAMSHDQILKSFDTLSQIANGWMPLTGTIAASDWSSCATGFVRLNSIISGVRSQELLAKLHGRLDILVREIIALKNVDQDNVPEMVRHHLYRLLTNAFELWYPFWVEQQDDRAAVAEFGVLFLESSVIASASKASATQAATSARILIAALCDCFKRYDEHEHLTRLVTNHVGDLAVLAMNHTPDVFIKHPALIEALDSTWCQRWLTKQFQKKSNLSITDSTPVRALAAILCSSTRSSVLGDVVSMIAKNLVGKNKTESSSVKLYQLEFLMAIDPALLTPEQLTALLDSLLQLDSGPSTQPDGRQLQCQLSCILSLLSASHRGHQLVQDTSDIWRLAALINKDQDDPSELSKSCDNLQILEEVARLILESMLTNKDRRREHDLLGHFSKEAKEQILIASKAGGLSECLGSLAVLKTAIVLFSQHTPNIYPENLIHQESKTMKLLQEMLLTEGESLWASLYSGHTIDRTRHFWLLGFALDILAAIPAASRSSGNTKEIHTRALALAHKPFDLDASLRADASQCLSGCFHYTYRHGESSLESLTRLAEKALESSLDAASYDKILKMYVDAVQAAQVVDKLAARTYLVAKLTYSSVAMILYQEIVRTFSKDDLAFPPIMTEGKPLSGIGLIQPVLQAALDATTFIIRQSALRCITIIVKQQSHLLNQYSVEQVVSMLHQLLTKSTYVIAIYKDTCDVLSALLNTQRARLQGRSHLIVALMQAFISALFKEAQETDSTDAPLQHAQALARLLESLCRPPTHRHRGKASELVDESRKAQAQAGQYAQYILHHYCERVLHGPLPDNVRAALMPGLWAVIEAMEMNSAEGVKSLSASMNNSQRAVLRSVYDDWKRFAKWEGM